MFDLLFCNYKPLGKILDVTLDAVDVAFDLGNSRAYVVELDNYHSKLGGIALVFCTRGAT